MTPEDEIRRAAKAKVFLEQEIFKEAFAEIEGVLLAGIRRTAFTDEKLREKFCMRYDLLHSLRDQIQSYVETGMLAEEELKRKSMQERVRLAYDAMVG